LKLLLTDATNPLGEALAHQLEHEPFSLLTPDPQQLDWTDASEVAHWLDSAQPGLILNTLGWSPSLSATQLAFVPAVSRALARACRSPDIPVIHFSSYRVFDGSSKSSHSERDQPEPQSDQGRAWLAAEEALAAQKKRWLVLRLSWLLTARGPGPLAQFLAAAWAGEPIRANTRLRGSPTLLSDLVRVVIAMIKQIDCGADTWGLMHYAGSQACNQAELAEAVLGVLGELRPEWTLPPLERDEVLPEAEPVSAVLSCRRVRDAFGVHARHWEPGLKPLVRQWLYQRGQGVNADSPEPLH